MNSPTRRQREVLDFIVRFTESHGYRPSYQVIARHLGVSSRAGIGRIVQDLEAQGLITRRREDGHFYLDLSHESSRNGAGGTLIEWVDLPTDPNGDGWEGHPFHVPEFMLGLQTADRLRAFRVPDDEMAGDGICRGDVVLIELRQFVRDGEKVLAIVNDNEAVLRRFFRFGSEVELRASTEPVNGPPRMIPANRVKVKGVYRGLLRPLG